MMFQPVLLLLLLHCSYSEFIDCTGSHQCYNDTIVCSTTSNEDCTIHCDGDSSCSLSTIICPQSQSAKCSLYCIDSLSCHATQIQAESSLSLTVISNGYNALSSSKIYCPSHSNTCNITYIGSQNGLNDINIYNENNFNTINIGCKSTKNCWSDLHKPLLHYGDLLYSKTCVISATNICEPITILIANDNHLIPSTTVTKTSTTILTNDDTDNVLSNDKSDTYKNKLNNALIYISIGIIGGVIVSICGCFIIFCYRIPQNKSSKLRIQTPKNALNNKKNMNYNTKKLSPSLKKLSPGLTPTMVELPNVDFMMSNNTKMLTLSDELQTSRTISDGITVTVERYANSRNQCDEGIIYSQSQSPIQSMNLLNFVKSLSDTMKDDIIICGSDEENIKTPC